MTQITFTHIGDPTMLIEVEGWRVLTDPTFDPPGRRYSFGWGASSRKLAGPAVSAAEIGPLDAVLLTHDQHDDNLDEAGRALLGGVGTVVTTPPAARRLNGNAQGLAPWSTTTLRSPGKTPIEVVATPGRHGPPGSLPIVGAVTGFALTWAGQRHGALWISGDTVPFPGLREVARRLDVGTAVVHLGGVRFPTTGPLRYTMTAQEAIELCRSLDPKTVIPTHYEGWSHFRQSGQTARQAFDRCDLTARVRWLTPGEPAEIPV
jgi:L-ascorbate metabolism protein UlaG (beta-lactamase superfamily)